MKTTWVLTGQLSQDARLRSIPLHTMPFRVGRRTDLPLCLSRPSVSSLHAEFVAEGTSLFLRDLQSTNGTYVNGDRVGDQIEVRHDDMIQFADMPFRLNCQSTELDSRTYEVLSRSRLVGLETPLAMFRAAAQLNAEVELSRAMRIEGVRSSAMFSEPPHVLLNTHPRELAEEGLLDSMKSLRRIAASQPITVEIHEAAVTDVSTMKELRAGLDDLNMRLAFDDFGAGQARLFELAEVRPHYLKFDRQMVQDIHRASPQRQQVLAHLVRLVSELGVLPLAEGIECEEEGTVCREMGFILAQGFYYGKPAPVTAYTSPVPTLF